jgi:hypothetical protein
MIGRVMYSFHVVMSEPRPPSVNHLYRNGYKGKRVLTKEGETFKSALTMSVVTECMMMSWKDAIDEVYLRCGRVRLTIGLHTELYNAAWRPGHLTKTKKQPQCPYKTLDGTNYIKAIEDGVVKGTGIDDACHLSITIEKIDSRVPLVEVIYEILERNKPWRPNS